MDRQELLNKRVVVICGGWSDERDISMLSANECHDALLEAGLLLEVNTGAISRGWRTEPYPAEFLLRRIREKGGRVTVTSDAHAAAALTFGFADALSLLREVGFRSVWELTAGGWVERGIQKK